MAEYIAGIGTGALLTAVTLFTFLTPNHVAICEHEGGEWMGEVCVKNGQVIEP